MFKNPGTKIKNLANAVFWVEVIGTVLGLFAFTDGDILEEPVMAIVSLVAAVAVAYISSLFLAAFGELVETNTKLLEETQKKNQDPSNEYTKL